MDYYSELNYKGTTTKVWPVFPEGKRWIF